MNIRLSGVAVHVPSRREPLFRVRSLQIPSGSRTLIQGPSGKGKSTLLHLMAGLLAPTEGSVEVGGSNLRYLSENARCHLRRQHIGIVFQKLSLIDHLSAIENVLLPLVDGARRRAEAQAALEKLGLGTVAAERVSRLSLGEQQRVAVARVLVQQPEVILADEPTSSLDDANARAVLDGLLSIGADRTLVVVSHDHRIAGAFARTFDFERLTAT